MRTLLAISLVLPGIVHAAVTLDREFWETYRPYQQYSTGTIRDLVALDEGDLLETGRDIDGLELRVIGRSSDYSALISARVVIDRVARQRLQVKVVPYALSPNAPQSPELHRRPLTPAQADALRALLDASGFWDAPYRTEPATAASGDVTAPRSRCPDAGHWIVEAIRPGSYQLVARDDCRGLDPLIADIRDFLLAIVNVPAD